MVAAANAGLAFRPVKKSYGSVPIVKITEVIGRLPWCCYVPTMVDMDVDSLLVSLLNGSHLQL